MPSKFKPCIALIGGGVGALDAIDGAALADGDTAIVITDSGVYYYHLNATSSATENSPFRINPDTNAGTKSWHLVGTTAFIGARVSMSSDQSLSAATTTACVWGTEDEDIGGFFDGTTDNTKFVMPIGVDRVIVKLSLDGEDKDAQFVASIRKNTTVISSNESETSGGESIFTGTYPATVISTDYFYATGYSTNARNITANPKTWFSIEAVEFS